MINHYTVFKQWFHCVPLGLGENSSHQLINKPQGEIRSSTPGTDTSCPSLIDGSIVKPARCV